MRKAPGMSRGLSVFWWGIRVSPRVLLSTGIAIRYSYAILSLFPRAPPRALLPLEMRAYES